MRGVRTPRSALGSAMGLALGAMSNKPPTEAIGIQKGTSGRERRTQAVKGRNAEQA